MKISEKLYIGRKGLEEFGPINIVAFGDSVTHGAVAAGEMDFETVYWNRLRRKIEAVHSYMPVNVINAGIGGIDAYHSINRIDSQVLCHKPDLVIVCFGLNDVNGQLEVYLSSLETIFNACKNYGCETIFLTPNMLNTYVADDVNPDFKEYAAKTAEMQNGGKMDTFIYSAIDLAKKMDIPVCDCYSKWKELSKTEDTTMLLANRINHPTKEMHELFAQSLFEMLFPENENIDTDSESTMYQGK